MGGGKGRKGGKKKGPPQAGPPKDEVKAEDTKAESASKAPVVPEKPTTSQQEVAQQPPKVAPSTSVAPPVPSVWARGPPLAVKLKPGEDSTTRLPKEALEVKPGVPPFSSDQGREHESGPGRVKDRSKTKFTASSSQPQISPQEVLDTTKDLPTQRHKEAESHIQPRSDKQFREQEIGDYGKSRDSGQDRDSGQGRGRGQGKVRGKGRGRGQDRGHGDGSGPQRELEGGDSIGLSRGSPAHGSLAHGDFDHSTMISPHLPTSPVHEQPSQPGIVAAGGDQTVQPPQEDLRPIPSDLKKKQVKAKSTSKKETTSVDKSPEKISKPCPPPVISGSIGPLASDFTSLSIKKLDRKPPNRPGYGNNGYPIVLRANHFPLKITPGYIQHYDVTIDENKLPTRINREVFRALVQGDPELRKYYPVFDGKKNMYCIQPLSFEKRQKEFNVAFIENEREKTVMVAVKWAAQISLFEFLDFCDGKRSDYNLATIQALDNVLRYHSTFRNIPVGRNFFQYPGVDIPLGEGRQIWGGRFQSARISQQWKIVLNVDVANTAFYKAQSIIDFTIEFLRTDSFLKSGLLRRDALHLAKEIKNIKVESLHIPGQKRKYTVRNITAASAREQTFEMEENGKKSNPTVEQYFKQKYNINLRHPMLPCLHVGNVQRNIYLPMEICSIATGQRCTKKLTDLQTAQMIRTTAKPAFEREREIMKRVNEADFINDPHLKAFGISIDTRMVQVKGRVLDPPNVEVGHKQVFAPKDGSWDMRNKILYEGKAVKTWGIACLDRRFNQDDLRNFGQQFSRHSRTVGLSFDPRPVTCMYVNNPGDLENMFTNWKTVQHIQLAIVILPIRSSNYAEVKRAGDIKVGLMTQCVLSKNASDAKPATVINICLKINAKLGGINHIISIVNRPPIFTKEPVIVLGADVTHPSPGDMKPSIAAVVGSLDAHPCRYAASVRIQTHRKEEIEDLSDMIKELLKAFYCHTKTKPKKIIFYRDGVSEGQFGIILQEELTAIQRACQQLEPDYRPGITFVVVQKRHHTRLFCADRHDQVGRSGNIPAGTIVDHSITHPFEFDFYLCSHYGIQGTSRPTHYHVLWDDNEFTADDLQKLTYQLCHTYVRCTRSVSIPAPAYYAHHVAFRARYHLTERDSDSSSVMSGSSNGVVITEEMKTAVKIHDSIKNDMYYA